MEKQGRDLCLNNPLPSPPLRSFDRDLAVHLLRRRFRDDAIYHVVGVIAYLSNGIERYRTATIPDTTCAPPIAYRCTRDMRSNPRDLLVIVVHPLLAHGLSDFGALSFLDLDPFSQVKFGKASTCTRACRRSCLTRGFAVSRISVDAISLVEISALAPSQI